MRASSTLPFSQAVQALADHEEVRRVTTRYCEPWRAYHDERHLSELESHLRQAEQDGVPITDGVAALGFVLWHDAVYDPQAAPGRNEFLSAQLCRVEFSRVAQPVSVERACRTILATAGHVLPDLEASPDAALLLDCDLAILGAEPARFAEYDAAIRREYAHVPEGIYQTKRSAVLTSFLGRDRIYRTSWAWARWESKARVNLGA